MSSADASSSPSSSTNQVSTLAASSRIASWIKSAPLKKKFSFDYCVGSHDGQYVTRPHQEQKENKTAPGTGRDGGTNAPLFKSVLYTPQKDKLLQSSLATYPTICIHCVFSNLAKKVSQTEEVTSFGWLAFFARLLLA